MKCFVTLLKTADGGRKSSLPEIGEWRVAISIHHKLFDFRLYYSNEQIPGPGDSFVCDAIPLDMDRVNAELNEKDFAGIIYEIGAIGYVLVKY